ncbi:hypothetical protein EYR40_010425 [Pleurotus pulmonarius]|nr:hypothetical protein EYR40_010415 [Pleurotus pulmonarius]KAF4588865.1 hypothetical protein EYR40_010420 [Pleurotus pulmonarius]KAF4588870.1 hypothetical protein EYR40_010425 [Pleurotus pulmonarius]
MITSHRDGVCAAILAIRQGGEYQFSPLVAFVAFTQGETLCLFDATQATDITLLDSRPGVVEHGEVIYENAVSQACHATACYSPFFEAIQGIMSSSAVLTELQERFEGVCTILLSKTITDTFQQRSQGFAQKLGNLLKANTILATISLLHEWNPSAANLVLAYMVSPIVHAVYMQFTSQCTPYARTPIFLPMILLHHALSRHIPAVSRIGIPDSLHSFSPSPRFFFAPMLAPMHVLALVKMNPGTAFSSPITGGSQQARPSTGTLGKRQRSKNQGNTAAAKRAKKNNKENIRHFRRT